jgi:hypothetical protein
MRKSLQKKSSLIKGPSQQEKKLTSNFNNKK